MLFQEIWNGRIEQIALHPRIFRLHGFLTDAECEHIKRKVAHMYCTAVDVYITTPPPKKNRRSRS